MTSTLFFVLFVASLMHLFLAVYNRYLLCITDSPLKQPLHYAVFVAVVFVPTVLLLGFQGEPTVADALAWTPGSAESKALFVAMILPLGFWVLRAALWTLDRFFPEQVGNLLEERTSHPVLPPVPPQLPRGLRVLESTGDLELTERDIAVPGLAPAFDGFTIAQVSDVHFGQRLEMENYLLAVRDLVNGLNADVIVFTGDFVDRRRDIPRAVEYHAGFQGRLGSLCVMGNHDYWTRPERVLECLAGTPIRWLGGGERRILRRNGRRLIFTGTDFPWASDQGDWRRAIRRETGDALVFLSHTPDNAPAAARAGASLILSGHNHGGQICLPAIGPVVVPSRYGLRFAGGIYRVGGDSVLNVSRGVGVSSGGVRVNCPPEVCLLTLRPPAVDVMVGQESPARVIMRPVVDPKAVAGEVVAGCDGARS